MDGTVEDVVYVVHDNPVWRHRSNYIGMIDLAPFDLPRQCEQVWLKSLEGDEYKLCCIPFAAYGLSLGDIIRLDVNGKVCELLHSSGRRSLRILFASEAREEFAGMVSLVDHAGLLFETRGGRHLVVDVPRDRAIESINAALVPFVEQGRAFWEWSDVIPFSS